MVKVQALQSLPPNARQFFDEIARGLEKLYGPAAAQEYLQRARRNLSMCLLHSSVEAYAAIVQGGTAAIIIGMRRHGVGEISLLHVLENFAGMGLEKRLLQTLVQSFRRRGLDHLIVENASLCELDVDQTYRQLGFSRVDRELMLAPLKEPRLQPAGAGELGGHTISKAVTPLQYTGIAHCIVDAYTGHPDRHIHRDVHDVVAARDFIDRVAAGNYGCFDTEFIRARWQEGRCIGSIFGCLVAPDTGFVLQLVVDRPVWRQGIGKSLLLDLAGVYRRAGLRNIGLGVTLGNPARNLYLALGFRPVKPVQAYVWWRPGAES